MIKYYKTIDNIVTEIDGQEAGCWISVISPNEDEIKYIIEEFNLDAGFVRSSLDEEENSRIELEEDQTLIIVDYPVESEESGSEFKMANYYTMPMGIIFTKTNVVTISLKENATLNDLKSGVIKNVNTNHKTRFVLQMLLRISFRYLQYLKQIDKTSSSTEQKLYKSMKNEELIQLLGLGKSLVYFSTSLKSNELTLEKILRGRVIKLYDEDQDLLEDVLIEIKQAIEMANIYSSILSGTMDAFASVISNNVNFVMKRLTIVTMLMAVPTIVFSYYGMNVAGLQFARTPYFAIAIAILITAMIAFFMRKNDK